MDLTIQMLENCFNVAKFNKIRYVGILVYMEGFEKPEVIINQYENFDTKLEYYKNTYNEKLYHKFANGIKIIGFTYGDDFDDIENDLIQ